MQKCRVWDGEKMWSDGGEIRMALDGRWTFYVNDKERCNWATGILMFAMGQVDGRGNPIYQDDIVDDPDNPGGIAAMGGENVDYVPDNWVVVGNIYETPWKARPCGGDN